MNERLQSIRPRLEELARLDAEFMLGDAFQHEYRLEPFLTEEEVIAFETKHGIVLPTDYRRFLLEVGSCGAGPGYGLNQLGDVQHLHKGDLPSTFFALPFPLSEWLDITSNPKNLSEEELVSDDCVTGAFCLSHWGCGMYDLLVVSGEEQGHVWMDDRANQFGVFPVAPNREQLGESQEDAQVFTIAQRKERTTFLDWYEWWLDWSFEEVKGAYEE
jgi:hypothetical protein